MIGIDNFLEAIQFFMNVDHDRRREMYQVASRFFDGNAQYLLAAEMFYHEMHGDLPEWGVIIERVEMVDGELLYVYRRLH